MSIIRVSHSANGRAVHPELVEGALLQRVSSFVRITAAVLSVALVLAGCRRADSAQIDGGAASAVEVPPNSPSGDGLATKSPPRHEPTTATPRAEALPVCQAKGQLPLEAAQNYFDAADFEQALSCAAQAAALTPNDALAHTERANALAALERLEEAKLAYARALAVDPDSLDALLGAAHFYAVALPSTRELDALGSLYAERGLELARSQHEEDTALQFARISAMAFNDLGQSADAVERADWVLEHKRGDPEATYERAVGLFELCRFAEAKKAFLGLLGDTERAAHAHHHLGLLFEREGRREEAQKHFEQAQKLNEIDFPVPVMIEPEAFREQLQKTIASLPVDMRRDLRDVPVQAEDLPALEDLTSGEPPLSPTILGLFRGPSLGEPCDAGVTGDRQLATCRSVVLYRKNLARAVKTEAELIEQIRVTLLHEVGHLRGEDDFELAARGLE